MALSVIYHALPSQRVLCILVDFEWLPQNIDHDQSTHDNKIQLIEEAEK